ncbi:MAG: type II secretion system F family protein [Candidatus Omnitrophica bacterium]|nr:type II secretion system F family protein [Candidatus Omnitrophota bacterium]MDD5027472.1 type II secretion system F family protein [Candidatus Omnitrophota bacterium]MDD5662413.1 type II secretion system F family protein [Candidatus Omnitrophota bacterium]
MLFLIFIFLALATVLIVMGIRNTSQVIGARTPAAPVKVRTSNFNFLSAVFPFTSIILEKLNLELKIKHRLANAHSRLTPQQFFNLKLLFMLALVILTPIALGKIEPVELVIALALGYILPEIWLNSRIAKRKYAIVRVLPETVDLLSLCVDAGLDFVASIEWVIKKGISTNPMIEELAFVLEEIQWGKPRTQALKDMAKRLNIPEVNSFIQTLVQAERMGTPVAEAFGVLSEDARTQRFNRGERYAMKAPIKILIPLIFCILPVIAIIIGGPIFLQFTQGKMLQGF